MGTVIAKGKPDFTQKELDEGFVLLWVPLDEAISLLEHDMPQNYEGIFVQKRDLAFLNEAKNITREKRR